MKQRGPERPFSSMDELAAGISSEICCYYFTTRSTSVLPAFRQESGTTSWAHTSCYWKSAGVYVCVHVHLILKDQMHTATLLDQFEEAAAVKVLPSRGPHRISHLGVHHNTTADSQGQGLLFSPHAGLLRGLFSE